MVALLPTDVTEGPVVPGVLGDVADLVDRVVVEKHLRNKQPLEWKSPLFGKTSRIGERGVWKEK